MSELKSTYLPLGAADYSKGDPGRAAQVFYKIERGKVVMYNEKGQPFVDGDGRRYERKLSDSEAPEEMALRLAKIINKKLSDGGGKFNAPIKYPKSVFI